MADLEKTVKIIFAGEDKNLQAAISNVAGKFKDINSIADTISAPLAKAADGVLKLDMALAALAVGGLAYSLKTAGEFSTQFAEITTLFDDTGAGVDKFREDILAYAGDSVKSIDDINKAIYTAVSAGIDYKDALAFVSEAEKLSVAGKADLEATTKVLVSTLNAYGESVDKAGKYSDILFQTVKIGQTTLPELAGSLAQVTSLAAGAGVNFETLAAAIAALTAKGMPTTQAITALKGVLVALVKPTAEAQTKAAELGIDFSSAAVKAKGLEGVLYDVMKATGGNVDAISKLFGNVEGLNGVLSLGADDAALFSKSLTAMREAAGSTAGAYEKMVNSFENVNQKLVNNLKITFTSIGDNLTSQYGTIVGGFGNILKGMNEAVKGGAFDPLFDMLNEAGAEFAKWLEGVAKALPEAFKDLDFSKLLDAVRGLGKAIGEYFGDIDLTDVEDLHDFIQRIIDGIAGLIKITTGMVGAFRPMIKAIFDFLDAVAKGDEETQKMIGQLLAFGKIIQTTGFYLFAGVQALDKYGVSIEGLFKTVAGGAQIMWNGLQILINAIEMLFVVVSKAFLEFLDLLSGGLLGRFNESFQKMQAKVESYGLALREEFLQNGEDAARGLARMIDGFDKLGGAADENAGKIKEATKALNDIPETKRTTWEFEYGADFKKAIDDISKEFVRVVEDETKTALPAEVTIPVQAELDFDLKDLKINEKADLIQRALEFKAKIDISEAEQATERLKTMMESVNLGISSTGDLISEMFKNLASSSSWDRSAIENQINLENERREKQLSLQEELIASQLDYNRAKTEALTSGQDFLIKIEAQGLEPHLEAFMWKILENIQIRGNAEAAEFLLGWAGNRA